MILKNKKGFSTMLFGFIFVFQIVIGIILFLTVGMHLILYDYAIEPASSLGQNLVVEAGAPIAGTRVTAIEDLEQGFLGFTKYFDILFLAEVTSVFILSIVAAAKVRKAGIFSFFGFMTFGTVFLIFIMNFALQVRGWFLNEIVFRIITTDLDTPIMEAFFTNSIYIGIVWYIIMIVVNQVDFINIREKVEGFFSKETKEGGFEE